MKHYIALTKPRITTLILVCTGVGYFFGAVKGGSLWAFVHTMIGTALMASGTAALNQWYERDVDKLMLRTRGRPLPSGQLKPAHALIFGIGVSFIGFVELGLGANALAGLAGLFTLGSYLLLYTPLKKRSPICTAVGAIPGAMPPLIGYAGASGHITWEAMALFAILFVWQFPHFYAIAWMYREDYARGGIRMLPVMRPDGVSTARQIVICSLLLIPVSLIPSYLHMTTVIYFVSAAVLRSRFCVFQPASLLHADDTIRAPRTARIGDLSSGPAKCDALRPREQEIASPVVDSTRMFGICRHERQSADRRAQPHPLATNPDRRATKRH
jgi:heme o synthase